MGSHPTCAVHCGQSYDLKSTGLEAGASTIQLLGVSGAIVVFCDPVVVACDPVTVVLLP